MTPIKEYESEKERQFSVIVAAWHREKKRSPRGYPRFSLAAIGYLMFDLTPDRIHVVNERIVAAMERQRRERDKQRLAA